MFPRMKGELNTYVTFVAAMFQVEH